MTSFPVDLQFEANVGEEEIWDTGVPAAGSSIIDCDAWLANSMLTKTNGSQDL